MKALVSLAIVATVVGCSSKALEVGSNQTPDQEDAGYRGSSNDGWTPESACAQGQQLPIVGTWEGWIENKRFPSGSDAVRLVITHANANLVCGSVTLGSEQPPWPPPQDPELPYPEDFRFADYVTFLRFISAIEGRPVTLVEGNARGTRLQFKTAYAQWSSWCALQTAYPNEGPCNRTLCVPSSCSILDGGGLLLTPSVRSVPGEGCVADYPNGTRPIDCTKAQLCQMGPCTCTASGCSAPPAYSAGTFDFRINGDYLDGSVVGGSGTADAVPHGVHLTRTP